MKNLNFKIVSVFFVFVLLVGFTGCKKDATSTSRKELLTSHNWKMSSVKVNGVALAMDDCSKDDFLVFASNGTYTANPGAILCYDDDTILSGTWSLSSDEKSLTVNLGGDTTILTIKELTDSKIVVTETEDAIVYEETFIPV